MTLDSTIQTYNKRLLTYARQFGTESIQYTRLVSEVVSKFGAPSEAYNAPLSTFKKSYYNQRIDVVQLRPANVKKYLEKNKLELEKPPASTKAIKEKVKSYRSDLSSMFSQYYKEAKVKSGELANVDKDLAQKMAMAFETRARLSAFNRTGSGFSTKESYNKAKVRLQDLENQIAYALMQTSTDWQDNEYKEDSEQWRAPLV